MTRFYSLEDLAELLKVDPEVIRWQVESGHLRAYRIGDAVRIGESDFIQYLDRSVYTAGRAATVDVFNGLGEGATLASRKACFTFAGQSSFNYSGSVDSGTTIWPRKKENYSVRFDANQWALLLEEFRGKEVRAGLGKRPEFESLGQWIKRSWNVNIGSVLYVGGILIAEGYASRPRPGWIRIYERQDGGRSVD